MSADKVLCREVRTDPRGETWSAEVREHAARCASCLAYLAGSGEMTARLRALPAAREGMPDDLRDDLLRRLEDATAPEPAREPGGGRRGPGSVAWRWLLPAAVAASLVVGVLLEKRFEFGAPERPIEVRKTVGNYVADVTHDRHLLERVAQPLEVATADAAVLAEWLGEALDFPVRLPADSGPLALEGGRVWHTLSRLSALAVYTTPSGAEVVLFAVPAENLRLRGAAAETVDGVRVYSGSGWGYEARVWIEGNLAVAVTAPEGALPEDWQGIFLP